jgi:hypothetical protein
VAEGVSASSLQAGFVELASIVRALHGDWSAPADGYDGWTCHDLLAHLSSSEASLGDLAASSTSPPRPGAEPFDADRWNRSQIRRRVEKSPQDLQNEFDAGTTHLVEVLSEVDLARKVTIGAYPGYTVAEAMAEMLEHQRNHLEDLRRSLHAHPEL